LHLPERSLDRAPVGDGLLEPFELRLADPMVVARHLAVQDHEMAVGVFEGVVGLAEELVKELA